GRSGGTTNSTPSGAGGVSLSSATTGGVIAQAATTTGGATSQKAGAPHGQALLQALGLRVDHVLTSAQIADLAAGRLAADQDWLSLPLPVDPAAMVALPAFFNFGFDSGPAGALGQAALDGSVHAALQPAINLHFGLDSNGFFLDSGSSIGAHITGQAEAE